MAAPSNATRQTVSNRANGKCEYCLTPEKFSNTTFSIDHILPRGRGGTDELHNLAFSCQQCNNHKYIAVEHEDPATSLLFPLFNPRTDNWAFHFAWDFQYVRIVGLTGTGRATVDRLNLNRDGLVNLRELLQSNGLHP